MATQINSHATGLGGCGGEDVSFGVGISTGMSTSLRKAGDQPAAAHCTVSVARKGDSVVRHRVVAIDDAIRADIGMLGASDFITFACQRPSVVIHRGGRADNLAAVIGGIAEAYEIHDFFLFFDL